MTTLARRNSSIHKIKEYSLPKVKLEDEYEVLQVLQEGWRGKILLVEHRKTRNEVVLKAIHREASSRVEFFREFHYNYYLSPHPNILNAYDVAFNVGDYYIFAQEYAPFSDLTSNLTEVGLGEIAGKRISYQIASALDFMHSQDLVHRDVVMDNILVFNSDFSEIKLCDFGSTRKHGALIKRKPTWLPYCPPEVMNALPNETYNVSSKQDVWQFGILIYVSLTGMLPWQKADKTDPHFVEFLNWKKRKTLKTPKRFVNFTTRTLRLFKRLLEPKPDKRSPVKEVYKYMEDKWMVKSPKKKDEVDGQSVCYSTFSVHSSKIEKDKVLHALKVRGIETTVDRAAKRKRIREWIEGSVSNVVSQEDDADIAKMSSAVKTLNLKKAGTGNLLETDIPLSNISLLEDYPRLLRPFSNQARKTDIVADKNKTSSQVQDDQFHLKQKLIGSSPNINNNHMRKEDIWRRKEPSKYISKETLVLNPVISRRNSDKPRSNNANGRETTNQTAKSKDNNITRSTSLKKVNSKSQASVFMGRQTQRQNVDYDDLFKRSIENNFLSRIANTSEEKQDTAVTRGSSPIPARSRSARAKCYAYHRSKSLARDERSLQRSKTDPRVNETRSSNAEMEEIRIGSGYDSTSDESVTSVMPLAGYTAL